MSELLTREQILGNVELKSEVVHVPEWGGDVMVCELTAGDRMAWEWRAYGGKDSGQAPSPSFKVSLLIECVRTEAGEKMFQPSDTDALTKLGCKAIERVFAKAAAINRLTKKDQEELSGNS